MNLQELYQYTKTQVNQMQEAMPFGEGELLAAMFLCRIGLEVHKTARKYLGDQNEKMEILALPTDEVRSNGNNP